MHGSGIKKLTLTGRCTMKELDISRVSNMCIFCMLFSVTKLVQTAYGDNTISTAKLNPPLWTSTKWTYMSTVIVPSSETDVVSLPVPMPLPSSKRPTDDISSSTEVYTFPDKIPTLESWTFPEVHVVQGPNVLENSDTVLTSPITLDFLSTFSNALKVRVIEQQLQFCPYIPLCSFEWHQTIDTRSQRFCCEECSCKFDCEVTMNCCPDIIPDSIYNLAHISQHQQCVADYLGHGTQGIMAYATCPEDTDVVLKSNCTRDYESGYLEVRDILLVTDEQMITYRNIYCAKCSHQNPQNLTLWIPELGCAEKAPLPTISSENVIQSILEAQGCSIYFRPPKWELGEDKCHITISTCNQTGLWTVYDPVVEWACSFFTSPLWSADKAYFKNVFCMMCNGHSKVNTLCFENNEHNQGEIFSFSAILNVGQFERPGTSSSIQDKCELGSIWSGIECINAHCSATRVLSGNQCIPLFESMYKTPYRIHFRLLPTEYISTETALGMVYFAMQTAQDVLHTSEEWEVHVLATSCLMYTDVQYFSNISIKDLHNSSLLYYDVLISFETKTRHDPELFLTNILGWEGTVRHVFDINGIAARERDFLLYPKDYAGDIYDKLANSDLPVSNPTITFGADAVDIELENIRNFSVINTGGNNLIMSFAFGYAKNTYFTNITINLLSMRSCPFVDISRQNLTWEDTLRGLDFQSGNFLNFSDFFYISNNLDGITVCLDTYLKVEKWELGENKEVEQHINVDAIISLCCVSLSIFCLSLTLLTFCFLPTFATLPWKNNFMLTLSLFLAQIAYLVGSFGRFIVNSISCISIGISIHFFMLMYVMWMHICTFHMFRVITSNKPISKTADWCKFSLYIIYSVVVSTALVFSNIIYSVIGYSTVGYGENICYINSQLMVLLTFGAPLALVVLSNLVMFGQVMRKIRSASDIQKNVKHEKNLIMIIAKLTVITGLTWIFGLVHMFKDIAVLAYIFIILNGSQGIFLMMSFVCNVKVLSLYKSRLTKFSSSNTYTS